MNLRRDHHWKHIWQEVSLEGKGRGVETLHLQTLTETGPLDKQPIFMTMKHLDLGQISSCLTSSLLIWSTITDTTFNNGSLGSHIDEEHSKVWKLVWIAEFSESSSFWTHLALLGIPRSMSGWVMWISNQTLLCLELSDLPLGLLGRGRLTWNTRGQGFVWFRALSINDLMRLTWWGVHKVLIDWDWVSLSWLINLLSVN